MCAFFDADILLAINSSLENIRVMIQVELSVAFRLLRLHAFLHPVI